MKGGCLGGLRSTPAESPNLKLNAHYVTIQYIGIPLSTRPLDPLPPYITRYPFIYPGTPFT